MICKSGNVVLRAEFKKVTKTHYYYSFVVSVKELGYSLSIEHYYCPSSWNHEKIAENMFQWALTYDDFDCLHDQMEFNKDITEFSLVS